MVKFCQRKERNTVLRRKAALKEKERDGFVNEEDLTRLKSGVLNITKKQSSVKNTRQDCSLAEGCTGQTGLAQDTDAPDGLVKTGVSGLVKAGVSGLGWKRLELDHRVGDTQQDRAGAQRRATCYPRQQ